MENYDDLGIMVDAGERKLRVMQDGLNLARAIRSFTKEMTEKVADYAKSRDGWDEEENAKELFESLEQAVRDGDYVSVANYSMFLHGLGFKPGRGQ